MPGQSNKQTNIPEAERLGGTWEISQARSMRLAKSEELPGESTVEAMGARSRCLGVHREGPVKGFRKLLGGVGRRGHGVKAAPRAPQMVAGVCIARRGSGSCRRGAARKEAGQQERLWYRGPLGPRASSLAHVRFLPSSPNSEAQRHRGKNRCLVPKNFAKFFRFSVTSSL